MLSTTADAPVPLMERQLRTRQRRRASGLHFVHRLTPEQRDLDESRTSNWLTDTQPWVRVKTGRNIVMLSNDRKPSARTDSCKCRRAGKSGGSNPDTWTSRAGVGVIKFGQVGRRAAEGRFDGGSMASASGVMLLSATHRRLRLLERAARCIRDPRNRLLDHARCARHAAPTRVRAGAGLGSSSPASAKRPWNWCWTSTPPTTRCTAASKRSSSTASLRHRAGAQLQAGGAGAVRPGDAGRSVREYGCGAALGVGVRLTVARAHGLGHQAAGLVFERWFQFAQLRHPQNISTRRSLVRVNDRSDHRASMTRRCRSSSGAVNRPPDVDPGSTPRCRVMWPRGQAPSSTVQRSTDSRCATHTEPSPSMCARPTRAPGCWRSPASPRSCRTISVIWPTPVGPIG